MQRPLGPLGCVPGACRCTTPTALPWQGCAPPPSTQDTPPSPPPCPRPSPPMLWARKVTRDKPGLASTRPRTSAARRFPHTSTPSHVSRRWLASLLGTAAPGLERSSCWAPRRRDAAPRPPTLPGPNLCSSMSVAMSAGSRSLSCFTMKSQFEGAPVRPLTKTTRWLGAAAAVPGPAASWAVGSTPPTPACRCGAGGRGAAGRGTRAALEDAARADARRRGRDGSRCGHAALRRRALRHARSCIAQSTCASDLHAWTAAASFPVQQMSISLRVCLST